MQNFVYANPTKVIFGSETTSQIGVEAVQYGRKALLVYGQGSIKRNSVYDSVVKSLRTAGVEWVEFGGVKANPILSHTELGVTLAKENRVQMIIAVGGGSVIDESKAIAAGCLVEHSVWNFYSGNATITGALPLLTVLTMPATGTEMNGGTVITNETTQEKFGLGNEHLYPKTSILDPLSTYSIPRNQTAYGAVDAVCHLLESYFTCEDSYTPIQDRYIEGIVRTIIEITETNQKTPNCYRTRSTFMWAATLAWNGIAPSGVGQWSTPNHLIGHSMSALYDTPHGASLSITLSGWMPYFAVNRPERLAQLGKAVFDIDMPDLHESAVQTITKMKAWFRRIGSPITLVDIGVDADGLVKIAENCARCSPRWGLPEYDVPLVTSILQRCEA